MDTMEYVTAATLLSLERVTYGWLWWRPTQFSKLAGNLGMAGKEPEMIYNLVRLYKLVQVYVFTKWLYSHYGFSLPPVSALQVVLGLSLFGIGQFLNAMVWYRLGLNGVCYGVKFGRKVPWCTEFPFNVLDHPQYLGVILSIWGLFVLLWDAPDWYMVPMIETFLYIMSMYFWEA